MGIGVQGEASGEVSEHSGDRLDVHAVLQCDGCEGVARSWNLTFGIPALASTRFSILFTLSGEIGPPLGEGKTYSSSVLAFCCFRTSIACCDMVTAR